MTSVSPLLLSVDNSVLAAFIREQGHDSCNTDIFTQLQSGFRSGQISTGSWLLSSPVEGKYTLQLNYAQDPEAERECRISSIDLHALNERIAHDSHLDLQSPVAVCQMTNNRDGTHIVTLQTGSSSPHFLYLDANYNLLADVKGSATHSCPEVYNVIQDLRRDHQFHGTPGTPLYIDIYQYNGESDGYSTELSFL